MSKENIYKITIIVNFLLGMDIKKYLLNNKFENIELYYGKGTVSTAMDRLHSKDDIKKSILIVRTKGLDKSNELIENIKNTFYFDKKYSGIIYAIEEGNEVDGIENLTEYTRVLVEVHRDFSNDVILLAESIGIKGGTVIENRVMNINSVKWENHKEGDVVSVIIITNHEKAKELINIINNMLPRILRNKKYSIIANKLARVEGLTI